MPTSLIGLVTAQKGDYIREKFGSVSRSNLPWNCTNQWNYFEFGSVVQEVMSFKDTSLSIALVAFSVRWSGTIYIISLEGIIRKILFNYFEFGLVDQEEMMSFKDNSYLKLWRPLCSAGQNQEEGIIMNISVELFLIWTSGSGGYAD